MSFKKNENQAISLKVTEDLTVTVLPALNHEFAMTTKEVAIGYGTSKYAIWQSKIRHSEELIEGKHFVTALTFCKGDTKLPHNAILWTKRGIVRLGFFIKSERAKLFRDWAEDLVISASLNNQGPVNKQLPAKRKHNRLTPERLADILADVCLIEDKGVRVSLTNKLTGRA